MKKTSDSRAKAALTVLDESIMLNQVRIVQLDLEIKRREAVIGALTIKRQQWLLAGKDSQAPNTG